MKKTILIGFSLCLALVSGLFALPEVAKAQSARSVLELYDEGEVWHMIYIRTESGHRERYLEALNTTWEKQAALAEELGFLVDHHVLTKWPGDPEDWDVLIIEIFPNMAFYDSFWENWARVDEQTLETREEEENVGEQVRAERELLGVHIAREVLFKPSD